jgi:hypothetical protein
MTRWISLWAGGSAYDRIREKGLAPSDVETVAGAAGGPKWLILRHLDQELFGSWLSSRSCPVFLIGSSIGAWRFAAAAQSEPVAALDRFQAAYMSQAYPADPSPETINRELERVLDSLMREGGAGEILSNPWMRLNILAVRCRGATGREEKARLMAGLAMAALANAVCRRALGLFFERTLFYDPRDKPPFFHISGFPLRQVALAKNNIKPALMASGSIPLLMRGITGIAGAPPGTYRDGGIIDYHMNLPLAGGGDGIVLFPHYAEAVVPGWLDKQLPWRRPSLPDMDRVLMITPSRELLEHLPFQKIPDRKDFYRFAGRDHERISYWQKTLDMGRRIAEDFVAAVETGRIRTSVRPLSDVTGGRFSRSTARRAATG